MVINGVIAEVREVEEDERGQENWGRMTPFIIIKKMLK
jgi:hypothetical protein